MLTYAQVQRYAAESGLRDVMVAEKEVVLTFLLQLMAERGILEHLAFKGGTCLRKMFAGSQGRFSTDLDFTSIQRHGHEDLILAMMDAFEEPFCGIRFRLPDDGYYEAQGGLSWGVGPVYEHDWNPDGNSEIKLQVSRREIPALAPEKRRQRPQNYFHICRSCLRISPAWFWKKSLPKKFAPAISAIGLATSTTSACSPSAP